MLVRRADELDGRAVEMPGVKDVTMRVLLGRDDGTPNFAMRQFTVGPGGHTPRHSHNYEHEVYVLEGSGRAECQGELTDIRAGDVLLVEPNVTHQFVGGASGLTFLCLVPVSFDCGGETAPTPGS